MNKLSFTPATPIQAIRGDLISTKSGEAIVAYGGQNALIAVYFTTGEWDFLENIHYTIIPVGSQITITVI